MNIYLSKFSCYNFYRNVDRYFSKRVKIGNVTKNIKEAKNVELVPVNFLVEHEDSRLYLKFLQWMIQKDELGQDMFLIGPPGSLKRRLVMSFAELTQREIEYIPLSRDTTESDIKQRREIVNNSAIYMDQGALRAALNGRLLVLDGIEKAERNVLPILNNLLENREMQLEDGRFLMRSNIYDSLLEKYSSDDLRDWKFMRCNEHFRVIALGLPVPKFKGNPLDPPLRSRFQSLHITESFVELERKVAALCDNIHSKRAQNIISLIQSINSDYAKGLNMPFWPLDNIVSALEMLNKFPEYSDNYILNSIYPYKIIADEMSQKLTEKFMKKFNISEFFEEKFFIKNIEKDKIEFAVDSLLSNNVKTIKMNCKPNSLAKTNLIITNKVKNMLADVAILNSFGDFCIIGDQGSGKSTIVEHLSEILGYRTTYVVLYNDMTARDLLQQRETDFYTGNTVWRNSSLVQAALEGNIAILSGLHRLEKGCLALLNQLVTDRQLNLFDGSRLLRWDRYDIIKDNLNLKDVEMNQKGLYRIHPNFRIIALAEPPSIPGESQTPGMTKRLDWLSSEIMASFKFYNMPHLSLNDEQEILRMSIKNIDSENLNALLNIVHKLRNSEDSQLRSVSHNLSLRQLLRITQKLSKYPNESVNEAVKKACLSKFLPKMVQDSLNQSLEEFQNFSLSTPEDSRVLKDLVQYYNENHHPNKMNSILGYDEAKIPNIIYYESVEHTKILIDMLKSFIIGYEGSEAQHLLLIGNQGVGKNKIADKFLQLLSRPREYIQLHRDTTVQTLTLQPSIKDGRLVYDDSPLVKAVKNGYVLVIDEADKASTQVTCVLKNLLTLQDMELSDGRRIISQNKDISDWSEDQMAKIIRIHPHFRMIVLANRPGFPFLGNDFYGTMGDVFSCFAVDNPDLNSEIEMLQKYGPSVPLDVIKKLVYLFGDLRQLADEGRIQYPYSTRELVNIVKHLEKYPTDPLASVLGNVFDFDLNNKEMLKIIEATLEKHGISLPGKSVSISLAKDHSLPPAVKLNVWKLPEKFSRLTAYFNDLSFKNLTTITPTNLKFNTEITRARIFTEMNDCISVNVGDYNIISDMIVANVSDSPTDYSNIYVHFVTLNPINLITLKLPKQQSSTIMETNLLSTCQMVSKVDLSDIFPEPQGAFRPNIKLAALRESNGSRVLFHEACSNVILKIDPLTGKVSKLNLSQILPENKTFSGWTNRSIFKKIETKVGGEYFHMLRNTNSGTDNSTFILHRPGDKILHKFDAGSNELSTISVPFPVRTVYNPKRDNWILLNMKKQPYLLSTTNSEYFLQDINPDNAVMIAERMHQETLNVNNMHPDIKKHFYKNLSVSLCSDYQSFCQLYHQISDNQTEYEFWSIPRSNHKDVKSTNAVLSHPASSCVLTGPGILVRTVDKAAVPREFLSTDPFHKTYTSGYLEVVNMNTNTFKYLKIPSPFEEPRIFRWLKVGIPDTFVGHLNQDSAIVTLDNTGCLHSWTLTAEHLSKQLGIWKRGIGIDDEHINNNRDLMIERLDEDVNKSLDTPKHGKIDPKNTPHVGGNTWAGGTGGRDTAGLGGFGGPYRLDAGHDVYQVPDSVKEQVPEHVKAAAREIAQKAWKDRLKAIKMSELDFELYRTYYNRVKPHIHSIKVLLDSLQAASKERQWIRHKTYGDLDDGKLVEGVLGERTIYRARGDKLPEPGTPQQKPKRLRVLVDVSGSMYRFNGHDKRMERQLEAMLMLMESFTHISSDKLVYEIYGHSGEGPKFEFVRLHEPPVNEKKRMDVISEMLAHSQFCMSGDYTLESISRSLKDLKSTNDSNSWDQTFLVVISDANLSRYGIPTKSLANLLMQGNVTENGASSVHTFIIFIGSLGNQAAALKRDLPVGHSFICLETELLPQILHSIFTTSIIS